MMAVVLRNLSIVIAVLIVGMEAPASQVETTGQPDVEWLYRVCIKSYTSTSGEEQAFCIAYISGVADLMDMNCSTARQLVSTGGLSNDTDRQAMSTVLANPRGYYVFSLGLKHAFIDWARRHPERRNMPVVAGVMEALREKWPCVLGQQ